MEWTDGSTYEGEWKKGIQHGWGTMSFPNGKVKEGYFEDNMFRGDVTKSEYSAIQSENEDDDFEDHEANGDTQPK